MSIIKAALHKSHYDYNLMLTFLILFSQNPNLPFVSQSPFTKYAQRDKTLQQIYKEASTTKAISIYKKFIKLGKEEGAIDHTISDDAIMSFLLSIVSIMQQPDYLKTSLEYRMGIFRLFLYGILGKEE